MTGAETVDRKLIGSVAASSGLVLGAGAVAALGQFGDLFLRWNGPINLGGRIDAAELVERHYADAFAAARFVQEGYRVADVGTGGGLPLIPLAIVCPGATFEAWEPTGKKIAFLRTAVRELALGPRVLLHDQRLPTAVPPQVQGRFDLAGSRATFSPGEWLGLGLQLVRPGGSVVVFGTDEPPDGCPLPEKTVDYGPRRRLLLFSRPG